MPLPDSPGRSAGRPPRPRRLLAGLAAAAVSAVLLYGGFGMHRGLLLSEDIKSRVWPWAPSFPAGTAIAAPALSDPVWQFVPWLQLARAELRAGRLPLWNPHQDGGVPLLGNSQSALGSPLTWPVLIAGVDAGWNLSLLLRLLAAFWGTWLWLRAEGRSRGAAALGGSIFALSGAFVAWLEHPQTLTAAPVPFLLLFASRLARRPSAGAFAGVVGATYLVLAGGHPETYLMAALLAAAVTLRAAGVRAAARRPLGAALLGAGLAAPLVLTFAEYLWHSEARFGADRSPFTLPLSDLERFLRPSVPGSNVVEAAAAVSVVALVLAAAAVVRLRRDPGVRFWTAAAAVMLAVTYDNPLSRMLAAHTPIHWSRALLFLPIPIAYLSSLSLDRLSEAFARRGRRRAAWLAAPAAAGLAALELIARGRGVHGHVPASALRPSTPLIDRLREDPGVFRVLPLHTFLPPDSATPFGLDDVRGYDAVGPRGWRRRREEIGRFTRVPTARDVIEPWDLAPGGAGLDFWNVKYVLLHPQFRFGADAFRERLGIALEEVYAGDDGRIFRNPGVRPRARLEGPGSVEIEERRPRRWRFRVDAPAGARLTVASPYFPGWTARVDGRRAFLSERPGDPFVIDVPAGRHRVELSYRPWSFSAGVALAGLSAALAGVAVRRLRRLRSGQPGEVREPVAAQER